MACHCHAADLDGGRGNALAEGQVVAHHLDPEQHLLEIAGHGELFHWIGQLVLFYSESDCAPRVIPGDEIHARADQLRDVETLLY